MQLNDFELENFIPELGIYSSQKWYIATKGNVQRILLALHGDRYLQYNYKPSLSEEDNYASALDQLKNKIGSLFLLNMDKYDHMFDTLIAEYNPIWNYDGENTLTYTKSNTGTSNHATTNTGTSNHAYTNTGTSNHSYSNTGTSNHSYSNTGTQQMDDTLSDTNTHSSTTFDSATEHETGKDVSQHGGYTKRTDNLAATDNRTDNLAATDNRTDNLAASDNRTDNLAGSDNRTDNLLESYNHTEIKHGNQGTTTTQSMILEEIALRKAYNFMNILCDDIANFVCY